MKAKPETETQLMEINYDQKKFKAIANTTNGESSQQTCFEYFQKGSLLTGTYKGGEILLGQLIGLVDSQGNIQMRYHHINKNHQLMTGTCSSSPEKMSNGKIRLHEHWNWTSGDGSSGSSIVEEI